MEENAGQTEGGRQLDATAANELAQELNDRGTGIANTGSSDGFSTLSSEVGAEGAHAVSPAGSGRESSDADDPLEVEEEERDTHLFPPDIVESVDIGGSPEDQRSLEDEYRRG